MRWPLESARQGGPDLKKAAAWAWCELGRPEDLGLVKVPAGEFLMGSKEGEGAPVERPQHVLYLPTFYIGKTPVTVEMYQKFLARSNHPQEEKEHFERYNIHNDFTYFRNWKDAMGYGYKNTDYPVVFVSWQDALAYAEWQGFGLPSEAEWEKAARGAEGRVYPWGNEWEEGLANTEEYGETRRVGLFRTGKKTTPVDQFSPRSYSPYGCVDMAGNVWEWTRSVWGGDPGTPDFSYPYNPTDGREDLTPSPLRVLRGGSFFVVTRLARCAFRFWFVPDLRFVNFGFRVVVLPFPL